MLEPLTKRQKEILDYIKTYCKKNTYAPTLEEIKKNFNLSSISTVHEHVGNLKNKGYLKKSLNQARGISNLAAKDIDGFHTSVPIVGHLPADNNGNLNGKISEVSLHSSILDGNKDLFALSVTDDSFSFGRINEGDILVFSRTYKLANGDIILCRAGTNKNPILKIYSKEKLKIRLDPLTANVKGRFVKNIDLIGKLVCLVRVF